MEGGQIVIYNSWYSIDTKMLFELTYLYSKILSPTTDFVVLCWFESPGHKARAQRSTIQNVRFIIHLIVKVFYVIARNKWTGNKRRKEGKISVNFMKEM